MSFQEYAEGISSKAHIGKIKKPAAAGLAAIGLAVSLAVGFSLFGTDDSMQVHKADAEEVQAASSNSNSDSAKGKICVHVSGCVNSPGVAYLEDGARVDDAIAAAGGLTSDASESSLNLARLLEDGEQIIVISKAEAKAAQEQARQPSAAQSGGSSEVAATSSSTQGKVNINTASLTELQTLSGIGESKAKKIIAYREQNGPFGSVDDLSKVSGIGEKTLAALRDSICV